MIGIQYLFSLRQIQAHLAGSLPRHIYQPIDIGTNHCRLGRHRRHLLELVEFGVGLGVSVLAEAGVLDALLQLVDFVVALIDIAELLLNGLHLLIQVVLALAAFHLLLHATANALFDLQQVDLGIKQRKYVFDARREVGDFENLLLLPDLQRHMRSHGIDQTRGLIDAAQRGKNLGGNLLAQLHVLFELAEQAAREYFGFARVDLSFFDQGNFGAAVVIHLDEALDHTTLLALDQYLDGSVWQLEKLQHGRNRANTVQRIFTWIVISGVLLRQQEDLLIAGHGGFECFDGFFTANEKRDHHVRVNHHIAQRQKGQFDGCLHNSALRRPFGGKRMGDALATKMRAHTVKNKAADQMQRGPQAPLFDYASGAALAGGSVFS